MKPLDQIRRQLAAGRFSFSRHAHERAVERNISDQEIRQAGALATIIENYPEDKYSPSCLLLGFTQTGRALHIQASAAKTDFVKIVTLYEPSPGEWIDYSTRR